jgi:hypothetical protein
VWKVIVSRGNPEYDKFAARFKRLVDDGAKIVAAGPYGVVIRHENLELVLTTKFAGLTIIHTSSAVESG